MELFKKIAELLSEGEDLNIVARVKADGKMVVSVLLNTGDKNVNIPPFILRGTPDEIDEGFIPALEPTLSSASGLVVDTKAAKDAVDKAVKKKQEEAKAAAAAKKSSSKKTADKAPAPAVAEPALIPDDGEQDPQEETHGDPSPATVEAPAAAPAPEPVREAPSEPAEQPSAPEAAQVITKDVNTLWKEAKEFYNAGDFKKALRVFEQCRAVASESQYGTIDKAIDNCTAKLASDLFNNEQ